VAIAAALPLAYLRERRRGNQAAVAAKLRGFLAGFRAPLTAPPRWAPAAAADRGEAPVR
jgi:hypothetical protein